MTQAKTITEVLAALILQRNVPLEAVAIAGEIIALDARARSYDQGAPKRATLERWSDFVEAYEVLLQRAHSAAADFEIARDGHVLIRVLSELKQGAIDL